jgi:ABC-type glycerol-3-phosphate transport system substrate-binding protein
MLKKMSRREMLKMTGLTGAGFILASCAAPATAVPAAEPTKAPAATEAMPAPTTAPAANTQEVTITYWSWADSNFPHFQKQAERWNANMTDKPKIKFDGVLVPSSDETITKGMNAMAAGSGVPDVFLIEISQISKFIKGTPTLAEQYLVALNDGLGAFNSKWETDYLGWAPYTWAGKTYGFEIGICPTAYYYRADLFEQAGVKMPLETWDDWMAAGDVMKKAGHAMSAFDTTGASEFIMTLYETGGALFDQQGNLVLQDERAYKSLELIVSAAKAGVRWPTEAFWGPPHYAALNDGTVAGVVCAIWYSPFILKSQAKATAGKWKVQPMPAWKTSGTWGGEKFNTRNTSTWGGTALTIPKQSANPQLTFDFLAYSLLTKEGATSVYQVMQQMPVVKSVIHDDSVTNIPDDFYGGQAVNKVFADIADNIPPKFPSPFWNEAEQEIGKIMSPLMKGDGTYQSQLDAAAEAIKNVIATGA